jgi:hypothetical protein
MVDTRIVALQSFPGFGQGSDTPPISAFQADDEGSLPCTRSPAPAHLHPLTFTSSSAVRSVSCFEVVAGAPTAGPAARFCKDATWSAFASALLTAGR